MSDSFTELTQNRCLPEFSTYPQGKSSVSKSQTSVKFLLTKMEINGILYVYLFLLNEIVTLVFFQEGVFNWN